MLPRTIIEEVAYGGHLQSLGAVAIIWTSSFLFQGSMSLGSSVAVYLVMYAIYLYNHLKEIQNDALTNPERTSYFSRHTNTLWLVFCFLAGATLIIATLFTSLPQVLFLGVIFFLGLLYTEVFKKFTRVIPGFKTAYVASVFSLLVFFPFLDSAALLPRVLVLFALWVFGKAVIMQIFLDIKDMRADAGISLQTIPVLLGRKKTFILLRGAGMAAILALGFFVFLYPEVPLASLALAVSGLPTVLAYIMAERGKYAGYLLEGAQFISWPFLVGTAQYLLDFYGIS